MRFVSKGMFFTVLAAVFFSCGVVLTKYLLLVGENPLNLTFWIVLFTVFPWLFLFKKHKEEFQKLSRITILLLIFLGIAGSVGINYLQALALAHTQAVNFAFIYRMVVVFTIFFAWLFFKEKITWPKMILVITLLVGTYFITTNGQGVTLTTGDLYSLLVAASVALFSNILVKHTVSKMHPDLSGSLTIG